MTVPGHSLAEVAEYVYGSAALAGRLRGSNPSMSGVQDTHPLPPGTSLSLSGDPLSAAAAAAHDAALRSGALLRTNGRPASAATVMVHTFAVGGVSYQLTDAQFDGVLRSMGGTLRRLAGIFRESADDKLKIRADFIDETNSVVRGISNLLGGTSTPSGSEWAMAKMYAAAVENLLPADGLPTQAQVKAAGMFLSQADRLLKQGDHVWMTFIDDTSTGGERAVTGLTVIRDASFATAAALGGAVAAPAVFGLVTAAGGSTLLAGGVAIGGGALTGGVIHGGLEGVGSTSAQLLNEGRVNWGEVGSRSWSGFKSGLGEGALGAASYFASAGLAARWGARFAATRLGRAAIGGTVGAGAGFVSSTYDVIAHPEQGSAWQRIAIGTAGGAIAGAGFSQININGLFRKGEVPPWMINSPWGATQPGSNTHPILNGLPEEVLPPLPKGYSWTRVNGNQWAVVRPPGAPDVEILPVGPDSNGAFGLNIRVPDPGFPSRMTYTYVQPRPSGSTYQGPRTNLAGYQDPAGNTYDSSHGIPQADTPDPAQVGQDVSADPANRSPAGRDYNRVFRRTLEGRIRNGGPWPGRPGPRVPGRFIEVTYYDEAVPAIRDVGTQVRIPEGQWFIELQPNGVPRGAWRFPINVARNTAVNFDADLALHARPLSEVPMGVWRQAGVPDALVAAGIAGERTARGAAQ